MKQLLYGSYWCALLSLAFGLAYLWFQNGFMFAFPLMAVFAFFLGSLPACTGKVYHRLMLHQFSPQLPLPRRYLKNGVIYVENGTLFIYLDKEARLNGSLGFLYQVAIPKEKQAGFFRLYKLLESDRAFKAFTAKRLFYVYTVYALCAAIYLGHAFTAESFGGILNYLCFAGVIFIVMFIKTEMEQTLHPVEKLFTQYVTAPSQYDVALPTFQQSYRLSVKKEKQAAHVFLYEPQLAKRLRHIQLFCSERVVEEN